MAKIDKNLQKMRNDGMVYALGIVKEKGIEELEKEIRYRKATYVPCEVTRDLMAELIRNQSENLQDMLLVIVLMALHDKFGFGSRRMKEFVKEYNRQNLATMNLDLNGEHYVYVYEFAEWLNENCDANFNIEKIKSIELLAEKKE